MWLTAFFRPMLQLKFHDTMPKRGMMFWLSYSCSFPPGCAVCVDITIQHCIMLTVQISIYENICFCFKYERLHLLFHVFFSFVFEPKQGWNLPLPIPQSAKWWTATPKLSPVIFKKMVVRCGSGPFSFRYHRFHFRCHFVVKILVGQSLPHP